jgi:hypothetical protein
MIRRSEGARAEKDGRLKEQIVGATTIQPMINVGSAWLAATRLNYPKREAHTAHM